MELIALAVAFALAFVPLFLVTELLGSHPAAGRNAFRQPADGAEAARNWLAAHPLGPSRPAAANDENERLAA